MIKKGRFICCLILGLLFFVAGCSEDDIDMQPDKDVFIETESALQQVQIEEGVMPELTLDEVPVYTPEPYGELITDLGAASIAEKAPLMTIEPTPKADLASDLAPEPIIGYIDARSLNMRKEPSTDSDVIKEYDGGRNIEIVGEEGDWYRVAIDGDIGYMLKEYIVVNQPTKTQETTETPTPEKSNYKEKDGYVDARSLNMRAEPSTDAAIVKEYSSGQQLKIVGETGNWYKVVIGSATGYMTKDYVGIGAPPKPAEAPTRGNSGTRESSSAMVWIPTKGGKKYHDNPDCSDMIDPDYVTLAEAIDLGFTACKKCY